MTYKLTDDDVLALRSYAKEHGKNWKVDLWDDWFHARTGYCREMPDRGRLLHCLRNELGPTWLDKLHLKRLMTGEELAAAKLAYFDEVPDFQFYPNTPEVEGVPKWSSEKAPPAIGEMVTTNVYNMNGFKAYVTGYFTQGGWLGVTADLVAPPKEFSRQNKGDPRVHVFGAEITEVRK